MTDEPLALFDVDALRSVKDPTVAAPKVARAVVVLGGHERAGQLDVRALEAAGIGVRRRRGGGGAVLLEPGACWVELWLPADANDATDVRGTAHLVGGWWRDALGSTGVDATVHRGDMVGAAQGVIACFAGLGPGECTLAGRKLVGLSQWRSKQGVLVSSVVSLRAPVALAEYLDDRGRAVPRLGDAASLADVPAVISGGTLATAFMAAAATAVPGLVVDASAFLLS